MDILSGRTGDLRKSRRARSVPRRTARPRKYRSKGTLDESFGTRKELLHRRDENLKTILRIRRILRRCVVIAVRGLSRRPTRRLLLLLGGDVERGEVGPTSVGSSRPASASTSTSAAAESGILSSTDKEKAGVGPWSDSRTGGKRVVSRGDRPSRWKTVARSLRRLTLAMLLLGLLAGCIATLVLYSGPLFLVQLLAVVLVAYLVAGGRFRWFYVALKTLPRDLRAVAMYAKLLWLMRGHERRDRNVVDVFQRQVRRHPDKVCLVYEDQEWTFQQVEDYANKVATAFSGEGYKKGDAVALLLENRPEFVATWLGLGKLGIISSLINTNLRKTSLIHSIHVAKCKALIYGTEFAEAVADIAGSMEGKFVFYRMGGHDGRTPNDSRERDLNGMLAEAPVGPPIVEEKANYNDKLLYIYTSGTTGLPKAAVITSSRFMFIASAMHYLAVLRDNDRIYTPLPLYHTAGGVMAIGQTLLHGNTTVIRKKFSASAYFADCIKYKCTVAQYIGEMCRYVLAVPEKPEDKKHDVRIIFGNGLRPQIWREFVDRFDIAQVVEFYGATEGNANIVNIDNTLGAVGFISRIIPWIYPISIIQVNAEGEPIRNSKGLCQVCEADQPGVFVGKIIPNNPSRAFLGYVDQKASQSKVVYDVFSKGDSAFLSGDILVADELGYLYFKDRTGDTYRWKGENVSTTEVEGILSNLVNYQDCVVYGVEVRGAEGKAGMAAIRDEDDTLNVERLARDVREQLPAYARPQFLRTLSKVDLTGTFKLKKKDLQEEGYDPRIIKDTLYYLDSNEYKLLTPEAYDQILQGKIKF